MIELCLFFPKRSVSEVFGGTKLPKKKSRNIIFSFLLYYCTLTQGLLFLEFNSKMKLGDQLKNFRTI